MYCTKCGNKLQIIKEQNMKKTVGFCECCNIKVELPEVQQPENVMVRGFDKVDWVVDKMMEKLIKWIREMKEERKHRQACEQDASIKLTILFGAKQVGTEENTYLRQKRDGSVYFMYDDKNVFQLMAYQWNGSEFVTVATDSTTGTSKYKERSRRSGRGLAIGAGAVIGTLIAPGVGTLVGAAAGGSGPRRTKTKGRSVDETNTTSKVEDVEKDTQAQLVIQNMRTKEVHRLLIVCNQTIDWKIRCLEWPEVDTEKTI